MPWPFTRKKNNVNRSNLKNKTNNNLRQMARSKAYWNTKKNYGRAGQSRVANIFNASGKKSDPFYATLDKKTEENFAELKKIAEGITQVEVNQMRQLGDDLRQEIEQAEKTGARTIDLKIPIMIGKVLAFAIGLFLFVFAFGTAVFLSILAFVASEGKSSGVGWSLVEGAINLMLWRQPPGQQQAQAGTIQVQNPMRAANV
jgi:hypothetical protein